MADYRILLTSDIHCTDLEEWYGVSDEVRIQHWVDEILAEHERHPFDLILINGDISLDYHAEKTPFDKGYSTSLVFVKMYLSQLPKDVPVLVTAGNHEQFPHETWEKITGCKRQCHAVLGNNTFIMLDNYCAALSKQYDSTDAYVPADMAYITSLMAQYPKNNVWLLSHYFDMEEESEAFRRLVKEDDRVKGLFMGHTHEHQLIPLGEAYGGKVIAQTGNFSYTMSGAANGGFWGFRDLIIDGNRAESRYIMVDSDCVLDEGPVHFDRWINEIAEYTL